MKKYTLLTVAVVLLCFSLISCNQSQNNHNGKKDRQENSTGTATSVLKLQAQGQEAPSPVPSQVVKKLISGPVTELPWDKDEKFLEAKKQSGTNTLLGAYRTVLKDPLPGEEYNVHLAASNLAGTVVKPGSVFSQNLSIGPYVESKGYQRGPTYLGTELTTTIGGGVCKIASTLYNVTVLSNLRIVERHNHSMPVPYVPYGQDATVAYGAKDFKFCNNTSTNVLIWAKGIDNVLYMAFYGAEAPPRVEWHHQILESYKAPRVYKTNPDLRAGEEKIILEGMDGASVKSWITLEYEDGTTETRKMAGSCYSPMPYLIEKSKE